MIAGAPQRSVDGPFLLNLLINGRVRVAVSLRPNVQKGGGGGGLTGSQFLEGGVTFFRGEGGCSFYIKKTKI